MQDNNVCFFMPDHRNYPAIHTVNFVRETKFQPFTSLKTQGLYKVHFVCKGTGKLHLPGTIIPLEKYDIFFTFPDMPHCIESDEDFLFTYVSFLGARSNMIFEQLKISRNNFLFNNCQEPCKFCENNIHTNPEFADLAAESILLYTFSFLGNRLLAQDSKSDYKSNIALVIKKHIDDNFSDPFLSLNSISTELSYNSKYLSTAFKKAFSMGINEYINTLRFQHARTLMQQGFTSISDISFQCGFKDAQYFSKVFKRKSGLSPKEYIASFTKK